jgi:hypothetical protein
LGLLLWELFVEAFAFWFFDGGRLLGFWLFGVGGFWKGKKLLKEKELLTGC